MRFLRAEATSGARFDCVRTRALAVTRPMRSITWAGVPGLEPVPLRRRDLDTGRDDFIGTIEHGSRAGFLGLAVSPNGKIILYARVSGDGSDVMMLEHFR